MLKKIAKIKNFNNFMLRHLVDFKYDIWWYKLYFNTLCACTSSAWGIFSKILHNIHIEAITWHFEVFCNIFVWKMSNWVCCDCPKPIWACYHQRRHLQTVCFFLYAIKCMLIFGVNLPIRYPFHEIWVSLRLNLRWILYES
jgi:hypothetical protein